MAVLSAPVFSLLSVCVRYLFPELSEICLCQVTAAWMLCYLSASGICHLSALFSFLFFCLRQVLQPERSVFFSVFFCTGLLLHSVSVRSIFCQKMRTKTGSSAVVLTKYQRVSNYNDSHVRTKSR